MTSWPMYLAAAIFALLVVGFGIGVFCAALARARGTRGRRRVYVCHPFSADPIRNILRVRGIARGLIDAGHCPVAPHLYYPQIVNEDTERDLAMSLCLELVSTCDELRVYGEPSPGMRREIDHARRIGVPVRRA